MIYVVLGMHKSGTTLVSQILHYSGINMGSDFDASVSYNEGNQYEREETRYLNEDILTARGVRSIDIDSSRILLKPQHKAQMQKIISTCSYTYDAWGFKDPRTCLVYPLWASELPEHRIVAIYRSPYESWYHYRPKHFRNRYRDPYLAWKYLNVWCRHNANILNFVQHTKMDYIMLEFSKLMHEQSEFDRLQNFIGFPLNDQRKTGLYRNRTQQSLLLDTVSWMLCKRKGYHPKHIIRQLEALRDKCGTQIATVPDTP